MILPILHIKNKEAVEEIIDEDETERKGYYTMSKRHQRRHV